MPVFARRHRPTRRLATRQLKRAAWSTPSTPPPPPTLQLTCAPPQPPTAPPLPIPAPPARATAFTLVEILIVVVIIGILASIVIPQFTSASETARVNSTLSMLKSARAQLELYKVHHNEEYPALEQMWSSMLMPTDAEGVTDPNGRHGPYLQKAPMNIFTRSTEVAAFGQATSSHGWEYDEDTGRLAAVGFNEDTLSFPPPTTPTPQTPPDPPGVPPWVPNPTPPNTPTTAESTTHDQAPSAQSPAQYPPKTDAHHCDTPPSASGHHAVVTRTD
ncbi:MAG: prepilin-type N-terminal cleavage/methylation domain-containing protein [Phycisphaeraceae bacterium]